MSRLNVLGGRPVESRTRQANSGKTRHWSKSYGIPCEPVEIAHTIDHGARIRTRLDAIAARLPVPSQQPKTIDIMPAQKAAASALLAGRIQTGKREE
jgi:hypothetical protein